jgi:quinol monooxygenase YgiN
MLPTAVTNIIGTNMTIDNQQWIVAFSIKRGKQEEFERLAKEISDAVRRSEPGTRKYEWFLDKKENNCIVIESYDSSTSGLAHVNGEAIKRFFPQILKVAKIKSFNVCGDPSQEIVHELADVGPKVYKFIGGFSR